MIVHSSRKKTFLVKELQTEDILDFQSWWPEFYKQNAVSAESTHARKGPRENFTISLNHEFIFEDSQKGQVAASKFIKGVEHSTFSFKIPGSEVQLPTRQAYMGLQRILAYKVADIKKFVPYVPAEANSFHDLIIQWPI